MTNYSQLLLFYYKRDLNKLLEEINAYRDESDLWKVAPGISNSTGNLVLHIIGNLNHFVGAGLGHTGYIRDRDAEFSTHGLSRAELIEKLMNTIGIVESILGKMNNEDLDKVFPIQKPESTETTAFFLTAYLVHLEYHLGQVNYHRRLLNC